MIDVVIINRSARPEETVTMADALCEFGGGVVASVTYIADRCSDEFDCVLRALYARIDNFTAVKTKFDDDTRRTSTLRNAGIILAKEARTSASGVLFLDGDRYPQGPLSAIDETKVQVLSLCPDAQAYTDAFKAEYAPMFWSAGVYIPYNVIQSIASTYAHEWKGYFWNEGIEDIWGIEDTFIGVALYRSGIDYEHNPSIRLAGELNVQDDKMEQIRALVRLVHEVDRVKWKRIEL